MEWCPPLALVVGITTRPLTFISHYLVQSVMVFSSTNSLALEPYYLIRGLGRPDDSRAVESPGN
jgi:hypothetical protein